jgi:hypothetical protein
MVVVRSDRPLLNPKKGFSSLSSVLCTVAWHNGLLPPPTPRLQSEFWTSCRGRKAETATGPKAYLIGRRARPSKRPLYFKRNRLQGAFDLDHSTISATLANDVAETALEMIRGAGVQFIASCL